jgi:hypothetical protein
VLLDRRETAPRRERELEPKEIEAVVKGHKAEIAACYDDARLLEPDLEGIVTTEFSVDEMGRVIDVRLGGLRPGLDRCVERVLRGMIFRTAPKGSGIVRARYPFFFRNRP